MNFISFMDGKEFDDWIDCLALVTWISQETHLSLRWIQIERLVVNFGSWLHLSSECCDVHKEAIQAGFNLPWKRYVFSILLIMGFRQAEWRLSREGPVGNGDIHYTLFRYTSRKLRYWCKAARHTIFDSLLSSVLASCLRSSVTQEVMLHKSLFLLRLSNWCRKIDVLAMGKYRKLGVSKCYCTSGEPNSANLLLLAREAEASLTAPMEHQH